MTCTLIDISRAQGPDVDFDLVKAARAPDGISPLVDGVISQATNGQKGRDDTFLRNFRECGRVGLLRGAYHFAHPDEDAGDAILEADNFVDAIVEGLRCGSALNILDHLGDEELLLALDIEEARSIRKGPTFVAWVLAFCERVEERTGITPWIYTGGPFFNDEDGTPDEDTLRRLSHFPLWLAAYVSNPDAFIPDAWRGIWAHGWDLWQQAGDLGDVDPNTPGSQLFHVPGIGGPLTNVDVDRFKGSLSDLRELLHYLRMRRSSAIEAPAWVVAFRAATAFPELVPATDAERDTDPAELAFGALDVPEPAQPSVTRPSTPAAKRESGT